MSRITLPSGATFAPAVGPQYYTFWRRGDMHNGHDFKWFSPKSHFQYGISLISAYFGMRDDNYRETMGFPKDHILIGDSGGFQIWSYGQKGVPVNIQPLEVLRWQERNCDIGMNLDVPVARDGNFDQCLKESITNFKIFEKFHNTDMPLYNVLHGRTTGEVKKWHAAVKDFPFDGWANGMKVTNYMQIYGYLYLREQDALNLDFGMHLFGLASIDSMIAMAMVAKRFDQKITYDSSSYSMGARDRRFYHSGSVRYFSEFRRECKKTLKNIPCDCPVCRDLKMEDYYSQTQRSTPILLSLHDLYQYVTVGRYVNYIMEDDEVLANYAKSYGEYPMVLNINRMFEAYEEGGIEQLEEDCPDLLITKNVPAKIRSEANLSGFTKGNVPKPNILADMMPQDPVVSEVDAEWTEDLER